MYLGWLTTRRLLVLGVVSICVAVVVAGAWAADLGPFGPSVSERIVNRTGAESCTREGVLVVDDARETYFECSFPRNVAGYDTTRCLTYEDGDVYDVTSFAQGIERGCFY
jgi:hypothetical protein